MIYKVPGTEVVGLLLGLWWKVCGMLQIPLPRIKISIYTPEVSATVTDLDHTMPR